MLRTCRALQQTQSPASAGSPIRFDKLCYSDFSRTFEIWILQIYLIKKYLWETLNLWEEKDEANRFATLLPEADPALRDTTSLFNHNGIGGNGDIVYRVQGKIRDPEESGKGGGSNAETRGG